MCPLNKPLFTVKYQYNHKCAISLVCSTLYCLFSASLHIKRVCLSVCFLSIFSLSLFVTLAQLFCDKDCFNEIARRRFSERKWLLTVAKETWGEWGPFIVYRTDGRERSSNTLYPLSFCLSLSLSLFQNIARDNLNDCPPLELPPTPDQKRGGERNDCRGEPSEIR